VIIDPDKCIGCEACHVYCPVRAIGPEPGPDAAVSVIDQDACVECGVCRRADVCPVDALEQPDLQWPRYVRAAFSNPCAQHRGSREMGRGTEEMKTNDVTGLFDHGVAGLAVEMGRPGLGTSFRDVEVMTAALAGEGVDFAPNNPVTNLMVDAGGRLEPEILDERALSAIIEFSVPLDRLTPVLERIQSAAGRIDTVFSLGLINRVAADGRVPVVPLARKSGFEPGPQCKTNVGLGRAKSEDVSS
jgi:Pyruvate/2-oxoacid:ferredoxin oxidoreductase delta subunit